MNPADKDPGKVLQRSFIIGIIGILLCLIPMFNHVKPFAKPDKIFFLNGFGLGAQLLALSMAVLVMRKRKIPHEIKEKAKRMIIVLGA
ncbi:hypothetical protein, partial [Echinicola sediminis]